MGRTVRVTLNLPECLGVPSVHIRQGDKLIYGDNFSLGPDSQPHEPNEVRVVEEHDKKGEFAVSLPLGPDFADEKYEVRSNKNLGPLTFVNPFMKKLAGLAIAPQGSMSAKLCKFCNTIPVSNLLESKENQYTLMENLGQLKESAKSCPLCDIILKSIRGSYNDDGKIKISFNSNFWLCVHVGGEAYTSPLKLYADPDTEAG
jgi:hypothetical protein